MIFPDRPQVIPEPVNNGIDHRLFDEIVKTNRSCNFHMSSGIYVTSLAPLTAEAMCLMTEEHINPRNIVHGAVSFAILDIVMGTAIRTVNRNVVTVQSTVNHMKPALLGQVLKGKGRVIDYGKKIIIAEADLFNPQGELIAVSRNTFYDKGVFLEMSDLLG